MAEIIPQKRRTKTPANLPPDPDFQAGRASTRSNLIVGIGASAGGIDAFKSFFKNMPSDTGMSFVLIQHLDPMHESALASIVSLFTEIPVQLASQGTKIRPNNIYIIKPDVILTIKNRKFKLYRPASPAARRNSVNSFFISLAEDQGENAVGIILSGFGNDGALGITAIKKNGGLTLSEAEFDHHAKTGMPQSAASTGFVDHVLAVGEMAAALQDYQQHRRMENSTRAPGGVHRDIQNHLDSIYTILLTRIGHDFSQYKTGTLMRRIQRRMHVLKAENVAAYVIQLQALPNEAEHLFRELLIGVTRFFRDPAAFDALKSDVLSPLLAGSPAGAPLRIWVAGCSTGEEAYSIAILMKECMAQAGSRRQIQIFATDIDKRAIEIARAAVYPDTIEADVSKDRLERYFVKEDCGYRINVDIREVCLFSVHDLIKSPPFSKIDLVSCRNLLIYFQPELQQQIITLFHFALRPGRYLFLGPSESVSTQSRLFTHVNKRFRLYSRGETPARLPRLAFSRTPSITSASRMPPAIRHDIDRRAARALAAYAPACIVLDQYYDIVRFYGPTAKYIEPASGVASLHLFNLLRTDLRGPAQAALKRAAETGERVLVEALATGVGSQVEKLNLIVEPMLDSSDGSIFALVFQSLAPVEAASTTVGSDDAEPDAAANSLKVELRLVKDRLRIVTDDLQSSNEELQSSNEEYLSVNEELQSTNEELETSKEELQSLNEELQTINGELNQRNESLIQLNSDLKNLFDSTSIATIFLDNELRIRRFTPQILEIFNVREGDEGRPISDIATRLMNGWVGQDVQKVLLTLVPLEREVDLAEGCVTYLMRIRPYRDQNNVINGVVITFIDISDRKKHQQAQAQLASIVEFSQDAIVSFDHSGMVTSWNSSAEVLLGYPAYKAVGRPIATLLEGSEPNDWPHLLTRLIAGDHIDHFDSAWTNNDRRTTSFSVTISPLKRADGKVVGASLVARDISERKEAERQSKLLLSELDHRVKNILAIVSAVVTKTAENTASTASFVDDLEGRIQAISKAHSLLTDSGQGEVSLRNIILTDLAPYDRNDGNISVTGCDVALTPKAGLAMAMAIHELSSNAAKYGPLSATHGRLSVQIEQRTEPSGTVLGVLWKESGGPTVVAPTRRGFGTTLIERILTFDFDAEVKREFLAPGLQCSIAIPITEEFGRVHDITLKREGEKNQ